MVSYGLWVTFHTVNGFCWSVLWMLVIPNHQLSPPSSDSTGPPVDPGVQLRTLLLMGAGLGAVGREGFG